MQPMNPGAAALGVAAVFLLFLVYLAIIIGSIVWCVYVARRLRDTATHLSAMSQHGEQNTRSLNAIAASLAQIAARETLPPPPPPAA